MQVYKLLEDIGGSLVKGDWITIERTEKDQFLLIRHPHGVLKEPIEVNLDFDKLELLDIPTTDEIDKTNDDFRNKLVGYCEEDDYYTHYDRRVEPAVCRKCGGHFSNWQGFQIQTKRTFNAVTAAKKKKPKGKK